MQPFQSALVCIRMRSLVEHEDARTRIGREPELCRVPAIETDLANILDVGQRSEGYVQFLLVLDGCGRAFHVGISQGFIQSAVQRREV